MNMSEIARRLGKYAADNSPAILTAVAVTGVATTAYLTGRATFKAAEVLRNKELYFETEPEREMEIKDKVALTWRLYIPAAGTGLLTVACIIGANRISDRRAAALASAYSLAQKGFSEYRSKVIEKIGATKEENIRTEIAQKHVDENPPSSSQMVVLGNGKVLCRDEWTGRYFETTMEDLKHAENRINHELNNNWYASLNDFYAYVGLPSVDAGEDIGWNSSKLLELRFATAMAPGNTPCLTFAFDTVPVRNYYRGH